MEVKMPGDPTKCRERAMDCLLLAKEASDAQSKQMFLDLAQSWSRLAAELDDTLAFLNTLKTIKFEEGSEERAFSDDAQHEAA
jgi:hypothetical protein